MPAEANRNRFTDFGIFNAQVGSSRLGWPSPQRNRVYPISHFQVTKSAIADLVGSLRSHLRMTEY